MEEEKVPGVEEEVVQPIESGFGGGGDWEAAPAGFAAAAAPTTGWDDAAAAAPNQQWDAATGGANWGDDTAAKETPANTW